MHRTRLSTLMMGEKVQWGGEDRVEIELVGIYMHLQGNLLNKGLCSINYMMDALSPFQI